MKKITLLIFVVLAFMGCADEEPYSEAAIDMCAGEQIEKCSIHNDAFTAQLYSPLSANLKAFTIDFTLANGATLEPVENYDGDQIIGFVDENIFEGIFNFTSKERHFTVISEDKKFSAVYTVTILQPTLPKKYHFEELSSNADTGYDIFFEYESEESYMEWASGNPGYTLTAMAMKPSDYPTSQNDNGYIGKCLQLKTCSTGSFGQMVEMPLAAGSMFIGSFDVQQALSESIRATHFGYTFTEMPVRMEGFYKYKKGDMYSINGEDVPGVDDHCDMYAMLYYTDDEVDHLDGTNSVTSDHIMLLAQLEDDYWPETDVWKPFYCDFRPMNGLTVDREKLANGEYKLGLVFSSSIEGASFNGAIGSVLLIDEVTIFTEDDL